MRADQSSQERLLALQDLDTRLGQLAHRRRSVPQIAELAQLADRAARLRDRQVALRTAISDLEREQARADADVAQVRARIDRDRAMLQAGSVASARQLGDLQHEIDSLTKRVEVLEDAELEVMERLEEAQAQADTAHGEAEELQRAEAVARRARDAAFADIDAEVERVSGERDRVLAEVPADLLALYHRVRADRDGVGAAVLQHGRCQGCQLTLTPADLSRIRTAPADEVLRCEECRRILVRTAESGL